MSRKLYKGEKRYVGVTISRATDESFTIASASYTVVNSAGATIQAGSATIDGARVFCLLDTTATGGTPAADLYESGRTYAVWLQVTITGLLKVLRERVWVEVA